MTIFNYLNDILFKKTGNLLSNVDEESGFNLYMINRWASMYSANIATVINFTTNRYSSIFDTKRESYNFLIKMLPKVGFRRINYIKKQSKKQSDNAVVIEQLAKTLELSEREINYYVSTNNVDLEKLKKCMVH